MGKYKAVLFDLDGTVSDSSLLIRKIMQKLARRVLGREEPLEYFKPFIGPPLTWSFEQMGVAQKDIPRVIGEYREDYLQVMTQAPIFPGVKGVLEELSKHSVPAALATSKRQDLARQICDTYGISHLFAVLGGAGGSDWKSKKSLVVGEDLNKLAELGYLSRGADCPAGDPKRTWKDRTRTDVVMVGDRIHDIEGAGVHGIPTILVTWGGTYPHEEAQAWKTVSSPAELTALLLGGSDL